MNKLLSFFSIALLILLSAASRCSREVPFDGSALQNSSWQLSHQDGYPVQEEDYFRGLPTLNLTSDSSYSGSTGCNQMNGSYQLEADRISISMAAMTKMGCPGSGEADFTTRLFGESRLELSGDTLRFLKEGGEEKLRFWRMAE